MRILIGAVASFALLAQGVTPPSVLIVNARVFTGVAAQPWAEAIAITGDRISHVGATADLRPLAAATTRVVDGGGRLVVPGLNDAHVHPGEWPEGTWLKGPTAPPFEPSLDDTLTQLEKTAASVPAGGWIFGVIGEAVVNDRRATSTTLDAVAAAHPVFLLSWSGHAALLNSQALRRLRVADTEVDPAGGLFGRRRDGKQITGLAYEYACFELLQRLDAEAPITIQERALHRLASSAIEYGVTTVQLMPHTLERKKARLLATSANLPVRIRVIDMPVADVARWQPARDAPPAAGLLSFSGLKVVLDGAPIERWSRLREPYADRPSTTGRLNFTQEMLQDMLRRAMAAGEQPMIHASGDAAVDVALRALEATGGKRWGPLHPRIEHADGFGVEHVRRALTMGVVVVQNPSHFGLETRLRQRLGAARVQRYQQVRMIVEAGVPLAIGSDGPFNPFLNIMVATQNPTNPAQNLSVLQALTAYTSGSAMAELRSRDKGRIAPTYVADLAVLSKDILSVAPSEIPDTRSVLTMVDGRIVHDRLEAP